MPRAKWPNGEASFFEGKISSGREEIFPHFAEPKALLRLSQDPSTFFSSWVRWKYFTLTHPISWKCILIFSSHLCLGSVSGPFYQVSHQNLVFTSPVPRTYHMPHPASSSQIHHVIIIWWKVQIMKIISIKFPPLSFYLVPLRSKHLPQQHTLQDPESA